jgi:hypothetical protein
MTTIVSYASFDRALGQGGSGSPAESRTFLESSEGDLNDAELRTHLTQALSQLEYAQSRPGVLSETRDQLASLMQSYMAENPDEIRITTEPAVAGGFEVKYDEGDLLGWFRSVFTWWRRIRPERWLAASDVPEAVGGGERLRVALLGDWGTGLYGAPVSARSIEHDARGYDLLLHLGDVYYSGTEKEVQELFLDRWPKVPGAVSRALNSNHEMYSGGVGLFRRTLPTFGQQATHFAAQTNHWLLVGLDSAYAEHDLARDQARWLERLLANAEDRQLVLFSHHQPFSLLESQGPKLVTKLARVLEQRRVFAWYWGHEHRCVLYDRDPVWRMLGRCVGHGGFPGFRDKLGHFPVEDGDARWRRLPGKNLVPGGIVLDAPNSYIEGHEEEYGAHGYVSLEFDGPHLAETVHLPDGTKLRERELA